MTQNDTTSDSYASNGAAMLMVGYAIPTKLMDELASKDTRPGIQAHKHQLALIRGIEHATGMPIDLLSVAAIGDYPRHPYLYMSGGQWSHRSGATDHWLPFVNIFPFKHASRLFITCFAIIRWLYRTRHANHRVIFHYSTASSQLYALLIASFLFRTTRIVIMSDPPSVDLPGEGILRWSARKLDRCIQLFALKKMDGLVVVADALATDFAPGVPFEVVEGIAPTVEPRHDKKETSDETFTVMYAGALSEEYGLRRLIDAMDFVPEKFELCLYGRGPMEDEIKAMAENNNRIKYFGFRPNSEILDRAAQVSALVNPRPSDGWFTRYSFPSKLLEYMATGCPVVATRLSTIPDSYSEFLIWIEDESPIGIADAIRRLEAMPPQSRSQMGESARKFVQVNKSAEGQGRVIWNFARALIDARHPPVPKQPTLVEVEST